jgi:catechol 2,3-dioxygenase-like lactoylglutathione lyase family enzyme
MQQQISVVTLGVQDLQTSKRFYVEGFGWTPVFENDEIVFYQMNGFVMAAWLKHALDADVQRSSSPGSGAVTLAHNVDDADAVTRLIETLVASGGRLLRAPDAPPYGGLRGYVADPDGHAWEIAWNPAWRIDAHGRVTFGV